jgi:hypothetical protein
MSDKETSNSINEGSETESQLAEDGDLSRAVLIASSTNKSILDFESTQLNQVDVGAPAGAQCHSIPCSASRETSLCCNRDRIAEAEIRHEIEEDKASFSGSDSDCSTFKMHPIRQTEIEQVTSWNPSEGYLKRCFHWRLRHRVKMIGALRRHIEWFVDKHGPQSIHDLFALESVKDFTDLDSDVIDAVQRSKRLRLSERDSDPSQGTVTPFQ